MNQTAVRLIEIIPYQERWPREFEEIGARLRSALGVLALRIDHVGSTSVPGLGAKDVIDIQVTVASLSPHESLVAAFDRAGGYRWREGVQEDHQPLGSDAPPQEWKKLYFREPEGQRRIHIHVRVAGAANQRYALLFRDFLRHSPLFAANYEAVKQALARLHPHDIDAYLSVKEPAFGLIMLAAEEWAKTTAWRQQEPDA
jgi:GrpB-like predicted nucleotidyltransferase (UPF0157 family)